MAIPSGLVCLLFTDVEGSTALWEADEAGMAASLEAHDRVLRKVIDDAGGYVFNTAGDSFACAFTDPAVAVTVARHIQTRLANLTWPGPALKVRIGLHVGTPQVRDDDYFGVAPAIAARVEAAGHGGQTLATPAVVSAAGLTDTVELGDYPLRGVEGLTTIHQLGAGTFPKLRITPPAKVTLPATPNPLLGREDDVQRVSAAVKSNRLVTLTGPGGTGKTRLAIEVADRVTPSFPDGVTFIDLTTVPRGGDILPAVLSGLDQAATDDPAATITQALAEHRRLLVLDNCEHIIDAAIDLVATVTGVPGEGVVLVTSRETLELPAERVLTIEPLATAAGSGPAETLFRDRAADLGIAIPDDPATSAVVTELVQRLDGMPLAIELAAARTRTMTPAQLLASLDDRFALLTSGRRRRVTAGRHAALETTVAWSYDLLDDDERELFDRCGILVGSADITILAALADIDISTATDLVDSLVAKSMTVPVEGAFGRRFRLLDTLRDFARARLDDRHAQEQTLDRLSMGLWHMYRAGSADMAADARLLDLAWSHVQDRPLDDILEAERHELRQTLLTERLTVHHAPWLPPVDLEDLMTRHAGLMDGVGAKDLEILSLITLARLEQTGECDTSRIEAIAAHPDADAPTRIRALLRAETYRWYTHDQGTFATIDAQQIGRLEDPRERAITLADWFKSPQANLDDDTEALAMAVIAERDGCGQHFSAAWLRGCLAAAQYLCGRPFTMDLASVHGAGDTLLNADEARSASLLRELIDTPTPYLSLGFHGVPSDVYSWAQVATKRFDRPDLLRAVHTWVGPAGAQAAFSPAFLRQDGIIDAIRSRNPSDWRGSAPLIAIIEELIADLEQRVEGAPLRVVPRTG